MKYLSKILNKRSAIFASVVQIILTILILPALCFILSLLSGREDAFSMITNLLDELPITGYWVNLIMLPLETPGEISGLSIYYFSVEYIRTSVFETCIVGMYVSLCKNIGIILKVRGIPLVQSILGIFLGCIMVRYFGISNQLSTLFYCTMLIILNVVVIWLIPKHAFYRKLLATFLGLGLQIIVAALSAAYVVYLTLILNGQIKDLEIAVPYLVSIFLPMLIIMAIDYFLLTPEMNSLEL